MSFAPQFVLRGIRRFGFAAAAICAITAFTQPATAKRERSELVQPVPGRDPVALVVADFDEDGVKDAFAIYREGRRGIALLFRGNPDAAYPHSPEVWIATNKNSRPAPFLGGHTEIELGDIEGDVRPVAADLNEDGHYDVAWLPAPGTCLRVIAGNGRGAFYLADGCYPAHLIDSVPQTLFGEAAAESDDTVGSAWIGEGTAVARRIKLARSGELSADSADMPCGDFPMASSNCMIVNTDVDRSDGDLRDGLCAIRNDTGMLTNMCTLRAALEQANFNNSQTALTQVIFTQQAPVITPSLPAAYPVIQVPMLIDGTSHPSGVVVLDGRTAATGSTLGRIGFNVNSPNVHIRGFRIERFQVGIFGGGAARITVTGVHINPDPDNLNNGSPNSRCLAGSGFQVGTPAPADRVVLMNCGRGIDANGNAITMRNTIVGFLADGITPASTAFDAVAIGDGTGAVIGTPEPNGGNLIGQCRNSGCASLRLARFNTESEGHKVQNNIIGLNANGEISFLGNGSGVVVSATQVTIGGNTPLTRNVISGHRMDGINALNSPNLIVRGNLIGTSLNGMQSRGNGGFGIIVRGSPRSIIGGNTAADRNIVSGNGSAGNAGGLLIAARDSMVQGNYVGLDVQGRNPIPNAGFGISTGITDSTIGTVIGGATPQEANVVSGNNGDGIRIGNDPFDVVNITVRGNRIGTDATGVFAVPNSGVGIFAAIGNNLTIDDNLIAGNGSHGMDIGASSSFIRNNRVGVNLNLTPLANSGNGILLDRGAGRTLVEGNTLAFNGAAGLASGGFVRGNRWTINSIFSNAGLGITVASGVRITPTITQAVVNGNATVVTGTGTGLRETPGGTVYLYENDACDPSGFGEGQTFVASVPIVPNNITTEGPFTFNIPRSLAGRSLAVSITADFNNFFPGSSVFSNCVTVAGQVCPTELTQQFTIVRSGFRFNRTTGRWAQTVTITNNTSATANGLVFAVRNLANGVTLFNPAGTLDCGGGPFLALPQTLPQGSSATLVLEFQNPSNGAIQYTPAVFAR